MQKAAVNRSVVDRAAHMLGRASIGARMIAKALSKCRGVGVCSKDKNFDVHGGLVGIKTPDDRRFKAHVSWVAPTPGIELLSWTEQPTYNEKTGRHSYRRCKDVLLEQESHGLRLTLGASAMTDPNIFIERQAKKWLLVVHNDGGDPLGALEINDDGTVRYEPDSIP